jgi:hypothetical protein
MGFDAALMNQSNLALIDEMQCVRRKLARKKMRNPKPSIDRSVVQLSHAEVSIRQVRDWAVLFGSELAACIMLDEMLAADDSIAA